MHDLPRQLSRSESGIFCVALFLGLLFAPILLLGWPLTAAFRRANLVRVAPTQTLRRTWFASFFAEAVATGVVLAIFAVLPLLLAVLAFLVVPVAFFRAGLRIWR